MTTGVGADVRRCGRGAALVAVGVLLTAGCGEGDDEVGPVTASNPAPTATPTVPAQELEAERAAEEEAAIVDVYHRYMDAVVAVEGGNVDPALFDGIAVGPPVEEKIAIGRMYQEVGVARQGAPSFSQMDVEVEGATATVWACVDNSAWVMPGEDVTGSDRVYAGGVRLDQVDGRWLVTGQPDREPSFTC